MPNVHVDDIVALVPVRRIGMSFARPVAVRALRADVNGVLRPRFDRELCFE